MPYCALGEILPEVFDLPPAEPDAGVGGEGAASRSTAARHKLNAALALNAAQVGRYVARGRRRSHQNPPHPALQVLACKTLP